MPDDKGILICPKCRAKLSVKPGLLKVLKTIRCSKCGSGINVAEALAAAAEDPGDRTAPAAASPPAEKPAPAAQKPSIAAEKPKAEPEAVKPLKAAVAVAQKEEPTSEPPAEPAPTKPAPPPEPPPPAAPDPALLEKLKNLEKDLDSRQQELEESQKESGRLKEKLEASDRAAAEIRQKLEAAEKASSELRQQLDAAARENTAYAKQIEKAVWQSGELAAAKREATELNERVASLQKMWQEKELESRGVAERARQADKKAEEALAARKTFLETAKRELQAYLVSERDAALTRFSALEHKLMDLS